MKRQLINPPHTRALYDQLHFSQAVRVGDLIWVSGQVGIDPDTLRPAVGMAAQARLAFDGVRNVLEAAGAGLADTVELTTFHIDLRGAGIAEFTQVKDECFPDRYPAWTAVGVTQLARPELLVEVRAVAMAGSG
ncbi:RidA family protein [Streptomyces varsoviensis]|uniref:Endoribonuclease L-PSP n=1 Tax=Streptomyces varsoviensis TaxID=67373 RepID=A0ABR5JEI9_9ACTN|nr:RidA family protein [Streptomyces varsoviensis]KOG91862.1 endoribonuclease L-PSP [Streptomyces varsoviensis]